MDKPMTAFEEQQARRIERLEAVVEAIRTYKRDFDSMSMEAEVNSRTKLFDALAAHDKEGE